MNNKTLLERFTELANIKKMEIVELQHIYLLKKIENESQTMYYLEYGEKH